MPLSLFRPSLSPHASSLFLPFVSPVFREFIILLFFFSTGLNFGVHYKFIILLFFFSTGLNFGVHYIRWGLENAYRVGLKIRIYLIVGFPGETDTTIQETLAFIKTCPWDEFAVYPSIPYPGTPLHDRPSEFGITYINKNYSEYLQIGKDLKAGFVFRTKDFDESTLIGWRELVMTELLNHRRTWAGKSMAFK